MNPQERVEALYKEVCRQADEMIAYRKEIERLGGNWQEVARRAFAEKTEA
jgi:hypothetical protein